jgi:hypothetical protein
MLMSTAQSSVHVVLGVGGTIQRWALVGGMQVIRGVTSKQIVEPKTLPFSPFVFATMR